MQFSAAIQNFFSIGNGTEYDPEEEKFYAMDGGMFHAYIYAVSAKTC
jgi:hypothetical protein